MKLLALFLAATAPAHLEAQYPTARPSDEYVVAGQDEAGFHQWVAADPERAARVASYGAYLDSAGVGDVVPTWQLLRTASDWLKCGQPAFEVPPTELWPSIVNTLRYAKEQIVPAVGAVDAVSVYRNPYLNSCAGGSARSTHRSHFALDLVPVYPFERGELMSRLCTVHARRGRDYSVGLGFYVGLRFHIDSWKYRVWGVSEAEGGRQCAIALARRENARADQPGGTP